MGNPYILQNPSDRDNMRMDEITMYCTTWCVDCRRAKQFLKERGVAFSEINIDEEITVLGALADSVQEVIELEPSQIEPAPRMGTRLKTEFIRGMGKRDNEFIIILDIDKVFSSQEVESLQGEGTPRIPIQNGAMEMQAGL